MGNAAASSANNNIPAYIQSLINSAPGSIDRRYPKWWSDNEGGIDFNAPVGTPVIALADGPVVGAGYFCNAAKNWSLTSDAGACDHGVITTRVTNADGTQTDLYYQHIILAPGIKPCFNGTGSCGGQYVKKGQVIGYISDFGMMEMGVNVGNSTNIAPGFAFNGSHAGWGGIWGADPNPGPHVDPEAYIRSLVATGGFPSGIPGSTSGSFNLFDPSSWLGTVQVWGEYIAVFLLALLLIILGLYLIAERQVTQAVKAVVP